MFLANTCNICSWIHVSKVGNTQTDMRILAVEQLFPATNSLPFPLEGVCPLPLHRRTRERWDLVVKVTVFPRWGQSSSGAGVVVHKGDVLCRKESNDLLY